MVRTHDESHVEELQAAGALDAVPETLEAGLMIAFQALPLPDVPRSRVTRRIQEQRTGRYRLIREFFRGNALSESQERRDDHRLRSIVIAAESRAVGKKLNEIEHDGVTVTALVRRGARRSNHSMDIELKENDIVVVFGLLDNLEKAERLPA